MYNLSCKAKSNLERTSHILYFPQIQKVDVLANRTNDYPNQHSVCSSFPSLKRHSNQTNGSRTGDVALPEWATDHWGSNSIRAAEHGMVSVETHGMLLSPVQHHWLTETTAPPLEEVHQVPHHSKTVREETALKIRTL